MSGLQLLRVVQFNLNSIERNDFHAILRANAGMGSMGRLNCLRGLQRPFHCVFLALRR
ncbi:MAG TPA: hypothetical protein VEH50_01220 [Methylomirabilota bacterium]|nr:hypothetical protein [Methylomirabilota bacterium]